MPSRHYEILNKLVDKYEKSAAFKGISSQKRKIQLKLCQLYSNYGKSEHYLETEEIEKEVNILFRLGFVNEGKNKDFGHRDIVLNTDEETIVQIYKYLNRDNLKLNQKQFLRKLAVFKHNNWIADFLNELEKRAKNFQSMYPYLETYSIEELQNIVCILNKMQLQQGEISYRKFSIMTLQDSKKLELYKNKIFHIIHDFYDDTIDNENEAFEIFGVMRNPAIVFVKGKMSFKVQEQEINLEKLNNHFAIFSDYIMQLEIINITVKQVVTVENWTSFNDLELEDSLIIYLGGFHNSALTQFLTMIYEHLKDKVKYYHFGDIDAGGFYIYLNLIKKTNLPFQTWKMDLETLRNYEKYARVLTKNDITRLKKLKEEYDNPIIDYMLEKNIKLEQEIITINNICHDKSK